MESNTTNERIYYNAEYRHGVDEKRRIQIPAKWRPLKPDIQFTLLLWPNGTNPEACLLVLPPAEMHALAEKMKTMSFADPKASALRRLLGKKSDTVSLDKAGRICLPEWMAKAAGIEKEAVLIGLWHRFEIWSPKRYEAAIAVDDALSSEAFKLI